MDASIVTPDVFQPSGNPNFFDDSVHASDDAEADIASYLLSGATVDDTESGSSQQTTYDCDTIVEDRHFSQALVVPGPSSEGGPTSATEAVHSCVSEVEGRHDQNSFSQPSLSKVHRSQGSPFHPESSTLDQDQMVVDADPTSSTTQSGDGASRIAEGVVLGLSQDSQVLECGQILSIQPNPPTLQPSQGSPSQAGPVAADDQMVVEPLPAIGTTQDEGGGDDDDDEEEGEEDASSEISEGENLRVSAPRHT